MGEPIKNLDELSKSIQEQQKVIDSLKGIPKILEKLSESVGLKHGNNSKDITGHSPVKKPDWDLGLSDDDDSSEHNDVSKMMDYEENKTADESNEELEEILKDIEEEDQLGPELTPKVADSFIKTVARPLTKENRSKLKTKIRAPSNCKEFSAPKINPELWRMLPPNARLNDVRSQQIQQSITMGLSTMANMANTIVKTNEIPKEVRAKLLQSAVDGANALGDQFQAISVRRRMEIKKFLNPDYSGICNTEIPPGEWLFGNDLAEKLKSTKTTSSLLKNTSLRFQRYQPYRNPRSSSTQTQNSLNSYRPSFQWGNRGNGQFRQRQPFNQNWGLLRQQSSYQNQNKFRKPQ